MVATLLRNSSCAHRLLRRDTTICSCQHISYFGIGISPECFVMLPLFRNSSYAQRLLQRDNITSARVCSLSSSHPSGDGQALYEGATHSHSWLVCVNYLFDGSGWAQCFCSFVRSAWAGRVWLMLWNQTVRWSPTCKVGFGGCMFSPAVRIQMALCFLISASWVRV